MSKVDGRKKKVKLVLSNERNFPYFQSSELISVQFCSFLLFSVSN